MARNCSEKNLNSGKIAATLSRAGQIIHRKSIDQREQTRITEENPRLFLGRSQLENLHHGHRSTDRSQPPKCAEEHRAENREGKGPRRRNAFKHGMTARTILPVLPQEDPKELEDRTQQAITAMKPRNPLELDLVRRAVRLSGEIDRAERVGTAHLAHRVRMDARSGTDTVSARELKNVHELGSALFFQAGIGPGYSKSSADNYPAVIVRRLEESAEGCR